SKQNCHTLKSIVVILFALALQSFIHPHTHYNSAFPLVGTPSDTSNQDTGKLTPAELKGGEEAYFNFINDNLNYPDSALSYGLSCEIWVHFISRNDGTVEVTGTKGCHVNVLNQEAIRVIKLTSGKSFPPRQGIDNEGVTEIRQTPITFE